jgi:hypothetical protein
MGKLSIPSLQTTYQPFIFAKLRLTNNADKACTDLRRLDALGTIQVRITRVEATSLKECTTESYYPVAEIEEYEKEKVEKKQLSYQTKSVHGSLLLVHARR